MRKTRQIALSAVICACWHGTAQSQGVRANPSAGDDINAPISFSLHEVDLTTILAEPEPSSEEVYAEDGPIGTDRPGFSDSASLVPLGRFQLESGYTFTFNRENDVRVRNHQYPELALRFGLTEWLELRTNWTASSSDLAFEQNRFGITHDRNDSEDGCKDLSVGVKVPILKQSGWLPNLSVIPTVGLPTGKESVSGTHHLVPELKFPWNYALNEQWTVYGSILGRIQDADDSQFWQTAVTLAGAYTFTDYLKVYLEYFGTYPDLRDEDCAHFISTGPIFTLTEDISLDMRIGAGLNEEAPDYQASIGFGIRL